MIRVTTFYDSNPIRTLQQWCNDRSHTFVKRLGFIQATTTCLESFFQSPNPVKATYQIKFDHSDLSLNRQKNDCMTAKSIEQC